MCLLNYIIQYFIRIQRCFLFVCLDVFLAIRSQHSVTYYMFHWQTKKELWEVYVYEPSFRTKPKHVELKLQRRFDQYENVSSSVK